MLADLRYALRSLVKSPGFTLVAVFTLAVGLGATTTVFSWIERVLLNPLPAVAEPGRIVALETLTASGEMIDTSYPDYRDYAAQAKTLSSVLVYKERPLNLGSGDHAERVWAEVVSGNFFSTLGLQPRLGRFFAPEDRADSPAAASVAVLSENLWRRRFAADPKILGQTIKLNQQDFTVIGIAPAEFPGSLNGLAFDLWTPLTLAPRLSGARYWLESRTNRALHTLARLAPGATVETARAELAGLARQLAAAHPDTNRGVSITALPVAQSPHGVHDRARLPLLLLLGVCVLVLLIVCANLSNLLFVRASARQREMCIRQALGAGWRHLARQLLAETLLLAGAGAALGLLFTLWLSDLLRMFAPPTTLPLALAGQLDARVFAVAAALALGVMLLAGFAPALWTARADLVNALRGGGRGSGATPRTERLRGALVAAEVAIAVVALACAGLAALSFRAAQNADPGFDARGVLLAAVKLDTSGYTGEQGLAFLDRLQTGLATVPGVATAALAENVPLGLEGGSWESVTVPGYTPAPDENMRIWRNLVSPDYFKTMRIPVLAGRELLASDDPQAPPVALVNETFARRYYGTAEVVGRTFSIWGGARTLRIVGVVKDGKYRSLRENALPFFYAALRQTYSPSIGVAVHLRAAGGDPRALLPALRREVRALDPNVPILEAFTLEDYIGASRFAEATGAKLLGPLSLGALALAALGLYGVLAFAVAQRTQEIGVRLALGAQPRDIVRLVLRRGFLLVALGLAAGLLAAVAVAGLLARLLYGVSASQPALLAAVAGFVALAGLLACWLPARRATKVDPMTALRAE